MTNQERFKEVPHFEVIKENQQITIPSIFMFKGGCVELFSFLSACREYNCKVLFENEQITVEPTSDSQQELILITYMSLVEKPKIAGDYLRY